MDLIATNTFLIGYIIGAVTFATIIYFASSSKFAATPKDVEDFKRIYYKHMSSPLIVTENEIYRRILNEFMN